MAKKFKKIFKKHLANADSYDIINTEIKKRGKYMFDYYDYDKYERENENNEDYERDWDQEIDCFILEREGLL